MSILSTNSRLIKVSQDYSAGSGISIDDKVISVTGEFGKTYSAGDNISIYEQNEQLYISSKDWTNDIANASANAYNEAVAQIPDPFDPTFISGQVDNKLDTTAFTNWQNGQYTTDLQTIEGQISNKLDESAFSQVSGTFLTAAPADMATTGDVAGIESSLTNKKDKQPTKEFNGSATKTIKNISQNANGELTVEFEDIDLPQEVPNVEITSEDNSVQVTETTNVQTNTKTFDISVTDSVKSKIKDITISNDTLVIIGD